MLAGVFPLIADAMFERMTFQGASSFLGGVVSDHSRANADTIPKANIPGLQSLILTFVPWVLVFYGARIRARSKIASVRILSRPFLDRHSC